LAAAGKPLDFASGAGNQGLYEKEDVMVIAGVGVPRDCRFQKELRADQRRPARQQHQDDHRSRPDLFRQDQARRLHRAQSTRSRRIIVRRRHRQTIPFDPASLDATSLALEAMSFKPDAISVGAPRALRSRSSRPPRSRASPHHGADARKAPPIPGGIDEARDAS
jgi:branched-chain amino acid transport system substrate-binding protein